MKKHTLLLKQLIVCLFFTLFLTLVQGCKQTDEDIANATIKESMKSYLFDIKSYKPISTVLDTCYSRISFRQDVLDAARNVQKCQEQAEEAWRKYSNALSSKSIYSTLYSSFERVNYEKYDKELKKYAREYIKYYERYLENWQYIVEAAENNDRSKVIGWLATHNFKAKSKSGAPVSSQALFILSPDLSQVLAFFPEEFRSEVDNLSVVITELIEDKDLLPEYRNNLEQFKTSKK